MLFPAVVGPMLANAIATGTPASRWRLEIYTERFRIDNGIQLR